MLKIDTLWKTPLEAKLLPLWFVMTLSAITEAITCKSHIPISSRGHLLIWGYFVSSKWRRWGWSPQILTLDPASLICLPTMIHKNFHLRLLSLELLPNWASLSKPLAISTAWIPQKKKISNKMTHTKKNFCLGVWRHVKLGPFSSSSSFAKI